MSARVYQCPGCWSYGLYEDPAEGAYYECECGEKLSMIDLRNPDVWAALMGVPPSRTSERHAPPPPTPGVESIGRPT